MKYNRGSDNMIVSPPTCGASGASSLIPCFANTQRDGSQYDLNGSSLQVYPQSFFSCCLITVSTSVDGRGGENNVRLYSSKEACQLSGNFFLQYTPIKNSSLLRGSLCGPSEKMLRMQGGPSIEMLATLVVLV